MTSRRPQRAWREDPRVHDAADGHDAAGRQGSARPAPRGPLRRLRATLSRDEYLASAGRGAVEALRRGLRRSGARALRASRRRLDPQRLETLRRLAEPVTEPGSAGCRRGRSSRDRPADSALTAFHVCAGPSSRSPRSDVIALPDGCVRLAAHALSRGAARASSTRPGAAAGRAGRSSTPSRWCAAVARCGAGRGASPVARRCRSCATRRSRGGRVGDRAGARAARVLRRAAAPARVRLRRARSRRLGAARARRRSSRTRAITPTGGTRCAILIARAIGDAYSLRALPRREQALAELAADDAAVRPGREGAARVGAAGVPRRRDRAGARGPPGGCRAESARSRPRWCTCDRRWCIAALVLAVGAELLIPGHPTFCVPLASAPGWIVLAISVRVAVMAPAWLGWRRAELFLRPA